MNKQHTLQLTLDILQKSRINAHVLDSHFSLGAVAESADGLLFSGVNWEGHDRTIGSCGETSAITNMISCEGPTILDSVSIIGGDQGQQDSSKLYTACSTCRQLMSELDQDCHANFNSFSSNGLNSTSTYIKDMMPNAFIFRNYLSSPLNKEKANTSAPENLRGIKAIDKNDLSWIENELFKAANRSFSPDKSYLQGAIIITQDGYGYCGSLFQAANFKSSKNAVSSAISMMISFDGIKKIDSLYFLHIENRGHYKNQPNIFPLEMLSILNELDCNNIHLFSENGCSKTLDIKSDFGFLSFCIPKKMALSRPVFRVPNLYRGLKV